MAYSLCFDLGNSRLKCAVFNNAVLEEVVVLEDLSINTIHGLLQTYRPTHSILSSVITGTEELEATLNQHTVFCKLNHQSKLSFYTPVGKPETIGADRLAICNAAVDKYPGQHILVIVLGTCITYNYINSQQQFLGGAISPGMTMRFKAMNLHTALLPEVKPDKIVPLIGYDTRTNLLSGVILGIAKELEGFITEYKLRYSNLKVILAGGDVLWIQPQLNMEVETDEQLLFKGLYSIGKNNWKE